MDMILAKADGEEIRILSGVDTDMDLGGSNDFEVTFDRNSWDGAAGDMGRIYVPDTEYGGLIRRLSTDTEEGEISVGGYTWRGLLSMRVIEPPAGQNYRTVSGELNTVVRSLLAGAFGSLMAGSEEDTGVSVSGYRFNRYCTLLDGLTDMLASVGYRLDIRYKQTLTGGYAEVAAVPIVDWSEDVELSQNYGLRFRVDQVRDGVNHLICLGEGKLKDRVVIHLYADSDGYISQTKTISGVKEVTSVYDSSSGADDLLDAGKKKLQKLISKTDYRMDLSTTNLDLAIGDVIGGRDYITGVYIKAPITQKVIKIKNNEVSVEYSVEG